MRIRLCTYLYVSVIFVTSYAAIQPIWLSPTNIDLSTNGGSDLSNVEESYIAQKGVWANLTVGAGSRTNGPGMAMDSKGTLWILFGARDSNHPSLLYNVWNYDPKTDLYRYVWGDSDTAFDSNQRDPGELRVPSLTNHPGFSTHAFITIDNNDNLWFTSTEYAGELWMFNTTSMMFVRMFGLDGVTGTPSFGTNPGQPADDVWPGDLKGNCVVTDSMNNIWILSGLGVSEKWNLAWHFNTTSYLWTFVSGDPNKQYPDNSTDYVGTWNPACFIDENDKVWLYGGYGYLDDGFTDNSPSMWTYDTRGKREWELEYQPIPFVFDAVYPVSQSADYSAANHPGGCEGCILTDRLDGTLMLLASGAYVDSEVFGSSDQVWQYSKSLKQWKLVYGDITAIGIEGVYSNYRSPGSMMPGFYYNARTNGKNMNGDLFVYGGESPNGGIGLKDIWILPNDQCSSPTANKCSVNADCIEEMIGYSCSCKQGYTGDGFTCDAPPDTPVADGPVVTPVKPPVATDMPSQKTSIASVVSTSLCSILLVVVL